MEDYLVMMGLVELKGIVVTVPIMMVVDRLTKMTQIATTSPRYGRDMMLIAVRQLVQTTPRKADLRRTVVGRRDNCSILDLEFIFIFHDVDETTLLGNSLRRFLSSSATYHIHHTE